MSAARVVALTLVSMGGCSALVVRPTPSVDARTRAPVCASYVTPTFDLLMSPVMAYGVVQAETSSTCMDAVCHDHISAAAMAGAALALMVSSFYGYAAVAHCRAERAALPSPP